MLLKLFASAFFGTPLAAMLAAHGTDTVVGDRRLDLRAASARRSSTRCSTATASSCRARPSPTARRGPHDAALFDIDAKYGDVVGVGEAVALLRGTAARTPVR